MRAVICKVRGEGRTLTRSCHLLYTIKTTKVNGLKCEKCISSTEFFGYIPFFVEKWSILSISA